MSTLSLRLPNSLHKAAKKIAKKDHVSMNQFVALAVAEKLASLETENLLAEKAKKGSRKKFLKVLASAPDIEPEEFDKL